MSRQKRARLFLRYSRFVFLKLATLHQFLPAISEMYREETYRFQNQKVYDVAQTPYQRVLAHSKIPQTTKETLTRFFESLDPFEFRKEIDVLVREIEKQSKWRM